MSRPLPGHVYEPMRPEEYKPYPTDRVCDLCGKIGTIFASENYYMTNGVEYDVCHGCSIRATRSLLAQKYDIK